MKNETVLLPKVAAKLTAVHKGPETRGKRPNNPSTRAYLQWKARAAHGRYAFHLILEKSHAIAHMRKSGGGSIVNLSSIYGLVGAADLPPDHASKGAVGLMSKNDALMYAKDQIRVNSVHPGFIWTPLVEKLGDNKPGFRENLDSMHPLGHVGEPIDVAYGILYLVSDESKFVTGSELVIDGGYNCR